MTTTAPTSHFLKLPNDVYFETIYFLPIRDIVNLRKTCRRLENITSTATEKIAETYINNLSKYIGQTCSSCDRIITIIQNSYNTENRNHLKIILFTLKIKKFPRYSNFYKIFKELNCKEELNHHNELCLCNIEPEKKAKKSST